MSVLGNTAISFDEEQAMLLEYAQSFCADIGIDSVREHLEHDDPYPAQTWERIVELGWTSIGLPESVGGAGMGIASAVPVLEAMGKSLLGTPLMSSLLAAQLLLRSGASNAETYLASIAAGEPATVAYLESEDWQAPLASTQNSEGSGLVGLKRFVMDGRAARWIIVVTTGSDHETAGDELVKTPALAVIDGSKLADAAYRDLTLIDLTRRAVDLTLAGVVPELVVSGDRVATALRDWHLLGALLVAAEATGAASRCLDSIIDYLTTRKQFDKLIGSYQALKHPSVEILNEMESARSFVYHAATQVGLAGNDSLDRDAEVACRMAKAQATEALKFAGDRAVQFHGGMGFTWDCDAQLFVRRAQWSQQQFGDAQHHREMLAPLLLDR
ncbi:MAG: acyl-CoA dehydrogenase family protein [Pseudomonadota bacterium]